MWSLRMYFWIEEVWCKKYITCFECNEPHHNKNECPKLRIDKLKKKVFRWKKIGLMATGDDFDFLEDDSEEEQASINASNEKFTSEPKSKSTTKEVFSDLSVFELELCYLKFRKSMKSFIINTRI